MYNIIPLATKALQYLSSTAQDLQTTYLPSLFPAVDTRPNILIIITDDQDDHMRSLDYMPNVKDHIIDKGAYHSSHYCTIALCCPSRTSLWTGLHGHNHNVTDVGGPYGGWPQVVREGHNDDNLFLWMQQAGYATYYSGKLYNGQDEDNYNNPPARGFDHSDLWVGKNVYWYDNVSHAIDFGPIQYGNGHYSTDLLAERIAGKGGYIEHAAKHQKPWLMVAAPVAPHVQIGPKELGGVIPPAPHKKYKDLYQDYKIPRTPDFNPDTIGGASYYRHLPKLNDTMIEFNDEYQRRRLRALKSVDDMVGEIIEKLKATKQLENTYVVFTTDNGFHIGQHRMTGGKECGLETTIRIPFAVRGPGVEAGRVNPAISNHVDMSPTLMAIAGAPSRPDLDGAVIPWTDTLGGLNGEVRREHSSVEFWGDAMANMDGQTVSPWGPKGWANNTFYSLRLLGPEYNFYYCVWCTNEHEMYDMRTDPYQLNNLFYDQEGQDAFDFAGGNFEKTVQRLDALLLTLKTCSGPSCRAPWRYMIEDGSINSLAEAMNPTLDSFFDGQPKVSYTACKMGHISEFEGAQDVNRLDVEYNIVESGPLLWS